MTFENITLELPQELIDTKIVEDFIFEIATKRFVLDLNHIHKGKRIIFSYNKNWKIIKRDLREEGKLKGLPNPQIQLLEETVDNNYHSISITQEQQQEKEEQDSTTTDEKKKEQKKDDERQIYPINKYSQGIPLVESILINSVPYFIEINQDKNPVFHKTIQLSDIDIVPPERIEYLSKEYSFQTEVEVNRFIELAKNETLDSLFKKIKNILGKYIDMDDDFINILTADIVFTYFQDKLAMTHYLLIVGDNDTGKSNILLVFSLLGYRAILDTAITPANIYNFGSQLEEGQNIIIEDEIGDIDEQLEKKKLYQVSYRRGTKVTRMYESNNSPNSKKKSSRQQSFFLSCFKMFASEKMPDKRKSKGFLERLLPLKVTPGNPLYDISEIVDNSGDKQFKELNQELDNTRKLLLMYRLLHYNDSIPDIKLNIKNRYKQLTKPLIRLFQNTKAVDEIIKSLSKYLIEKNQEKIDSLDSVILFLIIDLVSKHGTTLYNNKIWNEIKKQYPEGEVQDKSYSWYIAGCGSVSKQKITEICETKFGAKQHKDNTEGRGLIFDKDTLNKLIANYSIIKEIKIIKTGDDQDTFREDIDKNNNNNSSDESSKNPDFTNNDEGKTQEINNSDLKNDKKIDKKIDISSPRSSPSSPNPVELETNQKDSIHRKYQHSDIWICDNCSLTGDKWFMIKHPCKNNSNNNKMKPNNLGA